MQIRSAIGLASLTLAITAAACGDVTTTSRAPLILSVRSLAPSGGACCSISTPPGTEVGTATLGVSMKDANLTPGPNNLVTITRYHVDYSRADGRNVPGVDVPHPFDGVTTASIAGTGPVVFDLIRQVAKKELPLSQITGSNVVSTIAEITFFGQDLVGNDVSASGTLLINFRP
jgi:hypothetical protein